MRLAAKRTNFQSFRERVCLFIRFRRLPIHVSQGLPYFNFLKMGSGGAQVRQADFALSQREALENYLIKLIRAVVSCYNRTSAGY